MVSRLRRFLCNESGVTIVEGLIVFPLMLTMIITFVEFGYAMFQWEQTGRAVAVGARLAAVSNPVATDFASLDDTYPVTAEAGDPVPAAKVSVSCTGGKATQTLPQCNNGIDRIVRGSDGVCNSNFGSSTPGMCDLNWRILPENVIVTYTRDGLGFVGRRQGPVTTVTVQLRNMNFATFFVGALFGLTNIPIKASPASFTGEDLATCNDPVRTATDFTSHCP